MTHILCMLGIHQHGEWTPEADGKSNNGLHNCTQFRICHRCHTKELREEHDWSEWVSIGEDSHQRNCQRCGREEIGTHDGGSRTCNSCGGNGKELVMGGYGNNPVEYYESCSSCGGSGEEWQSCTKCGY